MKKFVLSPVGMFSAGLVLGIISRLADIYTQNLGNMLSQFSVWILFGVIITLYSESRKKAMMNILPFCLGMLITYYAVAVITKGVYSGKIIAGWTVFALASPLLSAVAYTVKGRGILPKIISVCIVAVSVLSSVFIFDGFRIYDFIINGILIYFLFFKK